MNFIIKIFIHTVDGGFGRKSCFWDFVRHLDRLDAVLMTRLNNSNICGLSSVVERKSTAHVYPQIGHFFTNLPERRGNYTPDDNKERNPLELDLIDEGSRMINNLKAINLKPQTCYRDNEPINLYHKVGHGTLDMYIISPSKDAKEVKEFLAKWNSNDQKLFASKDSKEFSFPIQNVVSICAMLVWQPANPDDNITRILFPGSTPDAKIFEGLEKVKSLEFLKHPVCSVKAVTPSLSTSMISKKAALKSGPIERIINDSVPIKVSRDNKNADNKQKITQQDNRTTEEQVNDSSIEETKIEKTIIKTVTKAKVAAKHIKTEVRKVERKLIETEKGQEKEKSDKEETDGKSTDEPEHNGEEKDEKASDEKTIVKKEEVEVRQRPKITKPKVEVAKTQTKSRIDSKPPKATDKKSIKKDDKDQKSSPTTPKKTADAAKIANGTAVAVKEPIAKAKLAPRVVRASPKSTPAKSTKDANNRKVLEARQKPATTAARTVKSEDKEVKKEVKEVKAEKKPIAKRPIRKASSPMKVARKETAVIRKPKLDKTETTDSSLVSTPSADDVQKKIIAEGSQPADETKIKELNDLKEEQEAVREIEAVFKKDQAKRRSQGIIINQRELHESTTEAEEEEEYLIIEKEEPYTEDSINEQESHKDEEEIQKHQRDSEESEKKFKDDTKEKFEKPDEDSNIPEEPKETEDDEQAAEVYKQGIQTEVQEIITSAKEIAKNKMKQVLKHFRKLKTFQHQVLMNE